MVPPAGTGHGPATASVTAAGPRREQKQNVWTVTAASRCPARLRGRRARPRRAPGVQPHRRRPRRGPHGRRFVAASGWRRVRPGKPWW